MLFSKRLELTEHAKSWCYAAGIEPEPFNIVTALDAMDQFTCDWRQEETLASIRDLRDENEQLRKQLEAMA